MSESDGKQPEAVNDVALPTDPPPSAAGRPEQRVTAVITRPKPSPDAAATAVNAPKEPVMPADLSDPEMRNPAAATPVQASAHGDVDDQLPDGLVPDMPGTAVVPSDLSGPGLQASFRPPQKLIKTQVVDRRRPSSVARGQQAPAARVDELMSRVRGLERELKTWKSTAKGLGLLSIALLFFVAVQWGRGGSEPQPAASAQAPQRVKAAEAPAASSAPQHVEARTEPTPEPEAEPEPEPEPEQVVAPAKAKRVERHPKKIARAAPAEAPSEPPPPAKPASSVSASIDAQLAKLRKSGGKDVKLFDQLRKQIDQASRSLPDAKRKKVQSLLGSAEMSLDVELLAKAARILKEG